LFNLKIAHLASWAFCELLPPLGKLPSLEMLSIMRLSNVKKVGVEFFGIETQTHKLYSRNWNIFAFGAGQDGKSGKGKGF
jgi:hypothetical protein